MTTASLPQVERLGDVKKPVRREARRALLALMAAAAPQPVLESAAAGWASRNAHVRAGMAEAVAEAAARFPEMSATGAAQLDGLLLGPLLRLLEDSSRCVLLGARLGWVAIKEF
jgi:hypothetical protein